jgi:hypothetical protein
VDCLLEWKLPGLVSGGRGSAPRKVTCTDGDRTCDVDPDTTDGACRVRLAMCVGVADPRLRDCVPAPLASVRVEEPAPESTDALDLANRNGLLETLRPLALGGAGIANATPNLCLPFANVAIPLRRTRSGRLRPGRIRVRVRARTTTDLEDLDTVVVRCRPRDVGAALDRHALAARHDERQRASR